MRTSVVEIEINHHCNRRCSYCPNAITERKTKGQMSLEFFKKIILELKDNNFTGRISNDFYNEPLLHPNIVDFVEFSKAQMPKVLYYIYTNGTLLSEDLFEALYSAGVDQFIITRQEADLNNLNYTFEKVYNQLSNEKKQLVKYRSFQTLSLTNRGGLLTNIENKVLPFTPCHIPINMITVLVDGKIIGCFEDYEENLVMGDLKNQTLKEVLNSSKFLQFEKELAMGLRHMYKPCQSCSRKEVLPPFI